MEKWDLYNLKREIVGEHIRGMEMPPERYHLVVHVWIKNAQGQYLMTKRSATRTSCPLKWECVGGAVMKGETSIQAALREVQEEVGMTLEVQQCHLVTTKVRDMVDGRRINDIVDVYLAHCDETPALPCATTDEVAQVRWMDKDAIGSLHKQGAMVSVIKDLTYFFDPSEEAFE